MKDMDYPTCPICGDQMRIKRNTAHWECEYLYADKVWKLRRADRETEDEADKDAEVPRVPKSTQS